MVQRALAAGAVATPLAFLAGAGAGGLDVGVSASLGVVVVGLNFGAHGLSLAWAAGVSVPVVQATALGGFVVRMGVITGVLFALDRTAWFSVVAFGLAVVVSTISLLVYEARLLTAGLGAQLDLPPDPAARRAHEALRLRKEAR